MSLSLFARLLFVSLFFTPLLWGRASSLAPIFSDYFENRSHMSSVIRVESIEGIYRENSHLGSFTAIVDGGDISGRVYKNWGLLSLGFGFQRDILNVDNETVTEFGENRVTSDSTTERKLESLRAYWGLNLLGGRYGIAAEGFWGKREVFFGAGIATESEVRFQEVSHELYIPLGRLLLGFTYRPGTRVLERHMSILRHETRTAKVGYRLDDLLFSMEVQKILTSQFDKNSSDAFQASLGVEFSWLNILMGLVVVNKNRHYKEENDVSLDNISSQKIEVYSSLKEGSGEVSLGGSYNLFEFQGVDSDIRYSPISLKIGFGYPI